MIKNLISLIILSVFFGCSEEIKDPVHTIGVVDSTRKIHRGAGYFKTKIFFSFNVSDTSFSGSYTTGSDRSYTSLVNVGDSILIEYDKINYERNKIISFNH